MSRDYLHIGNMFVEKIQPPDLGLDYYRFEYKRSCCFYLI